MLTLPAGCGTVTRAGRVLEGVPQPAGGVSTQLTATYNNYGAVTAVAIEGYLRYPEVQHLLDYKQGQDRGCIQGRRIWYQMGKETEVGASEI